MGHILGPTSHVSVALFLRLLLAMVMEILDRDCGPFWPNFAVFAVLGNVGNTIPSWGKRPSLEGRAVLVAYDQGTIALGFHSFSSGMLGDMQFTALATLPIFACLADFCPVVRPSPRGTAASQRDSKSNCDAPDQRGHQGS